MLHTSYYSETPASVHDYIVYPGHDNKAIL